MRSPSGIVSLIVSLPVYLLLGPFIVIKKFREIIKRAFV